MVSYIITKPSCISKNLVGTAAPSVVRNTKLRVGILKTWWRPVLMSSYVSAALRCKYKQNVKILDKFLHLITCHANTEMHIGAFLWVKRTHWFRKKKTIFSPIILNYYYWINQKCYCNHDLFYHFRAFKFTGWLVHCT